MKIYRSTRGARNSKLQVVITHASRVCSQHSFVLPLRMNGIYRTQFDHARNLITRVLTRSCETYAKHSGGEKAF